MVTISSEIEQLKEKVQLHQVCYEVWPECLMVSDHRTNVGFDLQLCGTHEHGQSQMNPGCHKCVQTYQDLRQIGEWILPKDERISRYEIEPFINSLQITPKRKFRSEVVLNIKILHRHGFDQPTDECEERCLKEMIEKLKELGVSQGQWRDVSDNRSVI